MGGTVGSNGGGDADSGCVAAAARLRESALAYCWTTGSLSELRRCAIVDAFAPRTGDPYAARSRVSQSASPAIAFIASSWLPLLIKALI
jgi:hypothetical protein